MSYDFFADSFHRKKLCSITFFKQSAILRFWAPPPLVGLWETCDDHLVGWKARSIFLLVLIIEFFSWGVTDEALRANIGLKSAISLQQGLVDSKFQVEGIASHQPFFSRETIFRVV